VENFGDGITELLMGGKSRANSIRLMTLAGRLRYALAAPARGITKTRTARRGRRTMEKMTRARVQDVEAQKSFLPRTDTRRERRRRCGKLGEGDSNGARGADNATYFAT
jgi:hypothetical protein